MGPGLVQFLFFVTMIAFLAVLFRTIWIHLNRLKVQRLVSKRGVARQSDRRQLTKHERRIYQKALDMHRAGKTVTAAQVLESLGMMRECISILEAGGYIKEAATTLLRMQRPNRAGVMYARHKKWREAAQCFHIARLQIEEARCLKECGELLQAAKIFKRINRLAEAADCLEASGEPYQAARLYLRLDDQGKALALYKEAFSGELQASERRLERAEIELLQNYVLQELLHEGFVRVLEIEGELAKTIMRMLAQGDEEKALAAFRMAQGDLRSHLLSIVDYRSDVGESLARLFFMASEFLYAGMTYERLEAFAEAAASFEKAGELERAQTCRDRVKSGDQQIPNLPHATTRLSRSTESREENRLFRLSDGQDSGLHFSSSHDDEGEKTVVLAPEQIPQSIQSKALVENKVADQSQFDAYHLFAKLSASERELFWQQSSLQEYETGEILFSYDEQPQGLYIIVGGSASAYIESSLGDQHLCEFTLGDGMGEAWVLADHYDPVKLVAKNRLQVRVVAKTAFLRILDKHGTVARNMYKSFTAHLLTRIITSENKSKNLLAS